MLLVRGAVRTRHCPLGQTHLGGRSHDSVDPRQGDQAIGPKLLLIHPGHVGAARPYQFSISVELGQCTGRRITVLLNLKRCQSVAVGEARATVRETVVPGMLELPRKFRFSRIGQVKDKGLAGPPAVGEEPRSSWERVLRMVR